MKCNNCERQASLRHVSGMRGRQSDGEIPLCQVHYAKWLFNRPDVDGPVGVGDGLYYIPVHLVPDFEGGKMFDVFVELAPGSKIRRQIDGYFKHLGYIEKELWQEVTGVNYNGNNPVGYVIVDVNAKDEQFQSWGIFAKHSVNGEATPPAQDSV